MGKKDKERAERERKAREDSELLHKTDELGLSYVDNELPDEEKVVSKGLGDSLLSMIPYTQAWYEAKASEQEMDDYKKILREKAKASDLMVMVKIGNHEDALDLMMSETNNDFFYFNKLRDKMTNEGKYHYEEKDNNPFKDVNKNNRIRKAINAPFDMGARAKGLVDLSISVKGAKSKVSIEQLQYELRNVPCAWR